MPSDLTTKLDVDGQRWPIPMPVADPRDVVALKDHAYNRYPATRTPRDCGRTVRPV
jgi:hypothetical protein